MAFLHFCLFCFLFCLRITDFCVCIMVKGRPGWNQLGFWSEDMDFTTCEYNGMAEHSRERGNQDCPVRSHAHTGRGIRWQRERERERERSS